jgi:pyridoxine 4-dehydrogenase
MKTALEKGANFWNGVSVQLVWTDLIQSAWTVVDRTHHQGMFYGTPEANSLQLLKYYFETYPEDAEKVVLSIKGAYNVATHTPDCSPEGVNASVEEALSVLGGVKKIDIFECARVDPKVPIEVTIEALKKLVATGKIGAIGLSEVSANTIRRAHAVHSIAAVEVELSLFTTDPLTNGITTACRERKCLGKATLLS